jgi:hypothetical protein
MPPFEPPRPPWEKVLYKRQPYPDNHVDDSFLESLSTNAGVQQYELGSLIRSSAVLTQQASATGLFLLVFAALSSRQLSLPGLALLDAAGVAAVGGCLWAAHQRAARSPDRAARRHAALPQHPAEELRCASDPAGPAAESLHQHVPLGAALQQAALLVAFMLGVSPVIASLTYSYSSHSTWGLALTLSTASVVSHEYRLRHRGG